MLTGKHFINGFVLPNLSNNDSIKTIISDINLSDIIITKNPFSFNITDTYIKRNDDNTFVAVEYELYFTSPYSCDIEECLNPDYFEDLYDMEDDYDLGHEIDVYMINNVPIVFRKTKKGWLRIK